MLIDSFIPDPDAVETHKLVIEASPEVVYRAVLTADLASSAVIKMLVGLRSLPRLLIGGFKTASRNRRVTIRTLIESDFGLLAEEPGKEIVLGVTGRFWRPAANVSRFKRSDWDHPLPSGFARGVWNFSVTPTLKEGTILKTETRVVCADVASRRKFRIYWLFVRPFSGLIRILMLRSIKRQCFD